MIQLNVEKYCHGCARFEPVVEKIQLYNDEFYEQLVECEHRKECQAMMRYLERKFKKETENA